MPKIYLSPSNQTANKCAQGDSECDHCNLLCDELVKYLDACKIDFKRAGRSETLASRVKASNAYKPDIHYCIHTNAGGGKRSVLLGYNTKNSVWLRLAEAVKKYRSAIYGGEIRFTQNTSFYEINSTVAKCLYDEVIFHDSNQDSGFFHENIRAIARATAQGFCEYFNIPFAEYDAAPADSGLKARLDEANSRLAAIAELAKTV